MVCPNCGGDYLHQERIEIFDGGEHRAKELHVVVDNSEITVNTNMTGNPSARRHGLKISFRCEECEQVSVLSFAQHKGITLVDVTI